MIQSMTGFFSESIEGSWGRSIWELRSLNHRYLDIQCRLPHEFLPVEPTIRKRIAHHFRRGKMEVSLHFIPGEGASNPFTLNPVAVKWLIEETRKVKKLGSQIGSLQAIDILHWPGVLERAQVGEEVKTAVMNAFENALLQLKSCRGEEGLSIKTCLLKHLTQMEKEWGSIKHLAPQLPVQYKDRLLRALSDIKAEVDPVRLEQEIVLAANKMDITEEIERLELHLHEVRKVLEKGGEVGKRLDFLMQELNREANTLAAKSVNAEVSHKALELKVHIEKMREQIQNLE